MPEARTVEKKKDVGMPPAPLDNGRWHGTVDMMHRAALLNDLTTMRRLYTSDPGTYSGYMTKAYGPDALADDRGPWPTPTQYERVDFDTPESRANFSMDNKYNHVAAKYAAK